MVLRTGLYYYMRVEDPWIKAVYAAILCWMFMLTAACYTQEAILQLPMNQIYNTFLAVLITLKNFDPAFSQLSKGLLWSGIEPAGFRSDTKKVPGQPTGDF